MDQADIGYDDFVEKAPKGKRKPLLLVLIIAVIVLLLAIGGFVLWSRFGSLPQAGAAPATAQEALTTPTIEEPMATEVAGLSVTDQPEATATALAPTEPPADSSAEAILPMPEFGQLLQTRANAEAGWEDRAIKLANNMAIREPFQWEYLEFEPGTLVNDVERYYIGLLNKDMGYLMTFNDKYPQSALAVFKFKQDTRRVTIEFREGQKDQAPTAFIFYEGW